MSDPSPMFTLTISGVTGNATSSPASADGPTPPASPAGQTTAPSGPDPAPASRSRSRAKAPVRTTHGICGPTSFASSVPAGPLSSWESRLRERLATVGSTECSLIWREKTTPAGASISRLAPWTPPTSEAGSTGSPWPTPVARDGFPPHKPEYVAAKKAEGHGMSNLNDYMAFSAPWPTPAAADLAGGRTNPPGTTATGLRPDGKKAQIGLPAAMKGMWSTPRASDEEKGGPNQSFGAGGQPLPSQAYATARSGPAPSGSPATTEKRGAPNPAFPCWLMGYPPAWLSGADLATPSSRKSRRK